jgi:hypothetical protein
MNQRNGSLPSIVLIAIAILVVVGGAAYLAGTQKNSVTVVERSTPQPQSISQAPLATSTAQVIFPVVRAEGFYHTDWKLTIEDKPFSCDPQNGGPGEDKVGSKTINGYTYCVRLTNGGAAAGTHYVDYHYSRTISGMLNTISVTLGQVNCGNYDEPAKSTCESAQLKLGRDLDSIVDQAFKTIR